MKKLYAILSLCTLSSMLAPGACFCADAIPSAPATALAAKAQSLKDDAQTRLDAMKDSKSITDSDSSHIQALQAQKTAADIAVKAHDTAAEWTNHADVIAQSAQKLDPTTSSSTSTATPSTSSSMPASKTSTSSMTKKSW